MIEKCVLQLWSLILPLPLRMLSQETGKYLYTARMNEMESWAQHQGLWQGSGWPWGKAQHWALLCSELQGHFIKVKGKVCSEKLLCGFQTLLFKFCIPWAFLSTLIQQSSSFFPAILLCFARCFEGQGVREGLGIKNRKRRKQEDGDGSREREKERE